MPNQLQIIQNKSFRYMDQTTETAFQNKPFTALTSFAIDDTLAESISDGASSPTMRLWVHPDTVVLGIIDGRLPFLEDGVRYLKQRGYRTIIRNSGGLAVALDDGVLNMSLIIPDVKHISIY
ncbi:MAG TPA: octanoyltransferase, partial [Bacillota bacterium]|nr:octanoyltransferase [Bacillota bacterium]